MLVNKKFIDLLIFVYCIKSSRLCFDKQPITKVLPIERCGDAIDWKWQGRKARQGKESKAKQSQEKKRKAKNSGRLANLFLWLTRHIIL